MITLKLEDSLYSMAVACKELKLKPHSVITKYSCREFKTKYGNGILPLVSLIIVIIGQIESYEHRTAWVVKLVANACVRVHAYRYDVSNNYGVSILRMVLDFSLIQYNTVSIPSKHFCFME